MSLTLLRRTAFGLLAAFASPHIAAAAWPERPISLVHGFGAGGNADVTARVVADRLSAHLGQTVLVEPKPGAGGRVAADYIARAQADGYTLFMLPGGHAAAAALHEQLPYHPIKDFTFVGLVTQIPFVVATYPEHPVKTVPELIAAAKHLPSRGGTAVPTMLLGKHIALGFEPPPTMLELLKDGKIRAIATTGPTRFFALPDVPTIGETIPGYEVISYFGLAGPPNLPADVVKRLNAGTVAMVKEPKTIERLRVLGSAPISSTPQGFKERVAADITKWTKLVTDVGIKRFDAQQ